MRGIASAVVVAGLLMAACSPGDGDVGPPPPGCQRSLGVCDQGGTQDACAASFGLWLESGCPAASRLGSCLGTGPDAGITYYYAPWLSLPAAEAMCDGAWVAQPAAPPPTAGTGGEVVSCTIESLVCLEVGGASAAQQGELRDSCAPAPFYAWSESGCATGGTVPGSCELQPPDAGLSGLRVRIFYSAASFTPAEAQGDCAEQGGAWAS